MSIRWMDYAWSNEGPGEALDRYVFVKLADNASDEGLCFPSIQTIVRLTRLSESTVRRCIRRLTKDGYVSIDREGGELGRGDLTHYQLHKKGCLTDTLPKRVSHRRASVRPKKGVTQTEPPHPHKGVTVIEPSDNTPHTPSPPTPQAARGNFSQPTPAANGTPPKTTPRQQRIADALSVLEVQLVMRKCNWSDRNLAPPIFEALEQYRRAQAIPIAEAAETMAHNWGVYGRDARFLTYICTPRNWIKQGHWCNPITWPYDQKRLEQYRNARVGSNSVQ